MESVSTFGEHPRIDYEVLDKISDKFVNLIGFTSQEINFTCIDAVDDILVLGNTIGYVFFFHRKYQKVNRLAASKTLCKKITCIKTVSSVDYMVAAGDTEGQILIFSIPKNSWEDKELKNNIATVYLTHIHQAPVTAIEWSLNAMKLFTGDEKGLVVYTDILYDYSGNVIESQNLLEEQCSIMQLSYHQPENLLVSTRERCFIYNQANSNIITFKTESNDRTQSLGATFNQNSSPKPLIFWANCNKQILVADIEGNILKKCSFEEALAKEHRIIDIDEVNSHRKFQVPPFSEIKIPNFEFNQLKMFDERYVLASHPNALLLLDLENSTIEAASYYNYFPTVCVAVNANEVFFLQGKRTVRRLGLTESLFEVFESIYERYKESNSNSPTKAFLDKMNKLKVDATKRVKPLITSMIENTISKIIEPIVTADEALLVLADHRTNANDTKTDTKEWYDTDGSDIEVLHTTKKEPSEAVIRDMEEITAEYIARKEMNWEMRAGRNRRARHSLGSETSSDSQSHSPGSLFANIPADILPDTRDIDEIKEDIRRKEEKLQISSDTPGISQQLPRSIAIDIFPTSSEMEEDDRESEESSMYISPRSYDGTISPLALLENDDENLSKNPKYCEMVVANVGKELPRLEGSETESEPSPQKTPPTMSRAEEALITPEKKEKEQECWKSCNLYSPARWISASNEGAYCGLSKDVYYAVSKNVKLHWVKQNIKGMRIFVSPSGDIIWKLDFGIAYAYSRDLVDRWKLISKNVESIAVTDNSAWYVSEGNIYAQIGLSKEKPFIHKSSRFRCLKIITKICAYDDNVWVLTEDRKILSGNPSSRDQRNIMQWKIVLTPDDVKVYDIALGCKNTGWIITDSNAIYFTDDFYLDVPNWYQIVMDVNENVSNIGALSSLLNWHSNTGDYTISMSENALWVLKKETVILQCNRLRVTGHRWVPFYGEQFDAKVKWKLVSAMGASSNSTMLWCLSYSNDLFVYHQGKESYRAIETATTENIVCLTTTPNSVWLVTESGNVFCRKGIWDKNPYGVSWVQAKIVDKRRRNLHFKHISLGDNSVWAVDVHNKVFAAKTDPANFEFSNIEMDWVDLSSSSKDRNFSKVTVGYMCECDSVWAIDMANNVYVREIIGKGNVYGRDWVGISGLKVSHVALTMADVWAISLDGRLYRRFGIHSKSYIGDYWTEVPGNLSFIAASKSEGLWGISKSTNLPVKYEKKVVKLKDGENRNRRISENIDGDWEFL